VLLKKKIPRWIRPGEVDREVDRRRFRLQDKKRESGPEDFRVKDDRFIRKPPPLPS